jgi:hypothetical protein
MSETVRVPPVLKELAERHRWPEELVAEALRRGVPPDRIANALSGGMPAEQFRERMEAGGGAPPQPDLRWMKVPTERPPKVAPGEQGLLLAQVERGGYGYAPDHWTYTTDMPRGSYPSRLPGLAALYTIYDKIEVWSENVRDLYEDAILHRWKPATDVPWDRLEPLPSHVEMAVCQIGTRVSEESLVALQVLSSWLEKISYGYHEVKLYLATVAFEAARHTEAFRKRALANGGGLGVQGVGHFNRTVSGSMKFTEFVVYELLQRASFRRTMLGVLEERAPTETDRWLCRMAGCDLDRWLAYSLGHVRFHVQQDPGSRMQLGVWLGRGEIFLGADLARDTELNEALMLVLGGDSAADGRAALAALRRRQVEEYLARLAGATVVRERDSVARTLLELTGPQAAMHA